MPFYTRHENVLHAEVNGEIIIMNPETLDYFELAGVAPRIWELLDGQPHSVESLTQQLTEEFEIDAATCAAEVEIFLTNAVDSGIAVIVSETSV